MPRIIRKSCKGKHACDKCGYTTDRKSAMDAHANRKRPCAKPHFTRIVVRPDGTEGPEVQANQCRFCNKTLSCKQSLVRHFGTCKAKKHHELSLNIQLKEVRENVDTRPPLADGKHRCEMCHVDFNSRQALHMHKRRICPAIRNVVERMDREVAAKTPQDQITPFRKFKLETASHVTDTMWIRWCRRFTKLNRGAGALSLMDAIWFNAHEPQNHTVRFTNKKLKYCEIWNGEKWQTEDKNWVADQMLDRIANDFDCFIANNKMRLMTMPGDMKFQRWHIEAVGEMVDVILSNKNPKLKREVRTRFLAKMYDFTKKVTLWASKNPFNREEIQKHQSAMVHSGKISANAIRLDLNRGLHRVHTETKELIETEVERRVKAVLASMGITEDQIENLRKRKKPPESPASTSRIAATTPATASVSASA